MLMRANSENRVDKLEQAIRHASTVTSTLMADVIDHACAHISTCDAAAKARIHGLIGAGACTDAALALIELALPGWQLRRLVHEDGEWICLLSSQWQLPDWLDDAVEARHEMLPLAIVAALVETLRITPSASRGSREIASQQHVAGIWPAEHQLVSCDNFS
jgi:hypothetical protein